MESTVDTLTQLGVAGGALLILALFLLGLLRLIGRLGGPVVQAHVETMKAFQDGQIKMGSVIKGIQSEMVAGQNANTREHRELLEEVRSGRRA